MPGTDTPGTGVFLPISFPAPTPSDAPTETPVAEDAKPAGQHQKAAVGRSRTFSAGLQRSNCSPDTAAPDSNPQGAAAPQHGHHAHGCHRYHSFSYFRPREQQQWADTTARTPAAPQLRPTSTGQPGWPNTPQVQPRLMAEGSPNSRKAWVIDLPNCCSGMVAASGAYSSACLPLAVSPTATAAAAAGGGGGGATVVGSSICSSSYCDAPRGSWSSSGCSSGRSSTDARGGTAATSAAYHSAFYHSSQLQPAGPSCSAAAPAAGSGGAVSYHRLLPVQPGEEQHHSRHSLGFDPAASQSGLLAQQLQPSMFGATDLVTARSLTASSSDVSLLLADESARLQLLQQLQQAPSALDLEEQINKELLWLLELRQRLTQTSPSARAAAAAGRAAAAAGSTSDSCVQGTAAAHYQQVMMPMRGGHTHQSQPACWFDDSAGRIHSGAPAACAAGFSNASSTTLQPAVGAGPAAVALQRAHSGALGSRLPSGSLGLAGAGGSSSTSLGSRLPSGSLSLSGVVGSSSNSLGSCSTSASNRGAGNGEPPTAIADMAPADVAAVVQTKLQQLQMIQELQGDLEVELLQLLPM